MAVVMGDVDMVQALGLAGIPCAYLGPPGYSARFSRSVRVVLPWFDEWRGHDALVATLRAFARSQDQPPILYPQTDATVLMVSRRREQLDGAYRFALADAELIEQLVDKSQFQVLAARRGLPVPPAQTVSPGGERSAPGLDVDFPVIIKPVRRGGDWTATGARGKALRVEDEAEWRAVWPRLVGLRAEVLVQQLVPGPESAIESYHAYVDGSDAIAAEFTGRKIRTFPPRYGQSSAVEIVALPDVAELGRGVLRRLGLRGVAKVDFKRDGRGRLHLLEVNPRFNLWHHPAAVAGINLPAIVHADLSGCPPPPGNSATRHVIWCAPLLDVRSAYAAGTSPVNWLRWARGCRAVSGLSWDDPAPFVRGTLGGAVRRRLRFRGPSGRRARSPVGVQNSPPK